MQRHALPSLGLRWLVPLLALGCATAAPVTTPVRYEPRPAPVATAKQDIETIIASNTGGPAAVTEFKEAFFSVKVISDLGASQQTVRYDKVGRIQLFRGTTAEGVGFFQVVVTDKGGQQMLRWGVRTLDDAQKLADAIGALAAAVAPVPVGNTQRP